MADYEIYEGATNKPTAYYLVDGEMYVKINNGLVKIEKPVSFLVPQNTLIREICEENFADFEEVSKLISKVKKL